MEKNSGVLANTLNRILRYKGSTLYRALTILAYIKAYKKLYASSYQLTNFWKKGRQDRDYTPRKRKKDRNPKF